MKTILHKANTRGHADHGWLKANHSFSFAGYYDEDRVHFGALRVLNDDQVAAGMGFGTHPHDNMEIITIPLEGELVHKDSMGNTGIISKGEIQVMSAGTGIRHSEYNNSPDKELRLLQIWLFPEKRNAEPRYDQKKYSQEETHNNLLNVVSPMDSPTGIHIHQQAWFSLGKLDKDFSVAYKLNKKDNGVYAFVIDGDISINGEQLNRRDALAITETDSLQIKAGTDAELLLMEVPMLQ
jgi:quercetin 2,3-dioxygenase